jgi:hypothetical protein
VLAAPVDDKPTEESDKNDWIAPAAIAGAAALAGATVLAVHKSSDSDEPKTAELVDETTLHKKVDDAKLTKAVDESTAHKTAGEELITEPAPQSAPSPVHGEVVPEAEVPKVLEASHASEAAVPTVVVSPSATEQGSGAAKIVQPTPVAAAGEIFANSVWNHSVSPFLQYSLENTAEGIRKRHLATPQVDPQQQRPGSSGSDMVSTRTHRNLMHNFWQLFFFGWLGGVGRFFGGMFSKKRKDRAASRTGGSASL